MSNRPEAIQLAHNLDMSVVAEGIENFKQVENLCRCSCDLVQGYVYAKPMPVSDFEDWFLLYNMAERRSRDGL